MAAQFEQTVLNRMIGDAADRAGVPRNIFASLVRHESGGDPRAVSSAGAIGLTQLMPSTAAGLGVDPWEPRQNLEGGARYLRQQYDRFGSWPLALAAYNAGPGAVEKYGGVPPYKETQAYVSNILSDTGNIAGTEGTVPSRQFARPWESKDTTRSAPGFVKPWEGIDTTRSVGYKFVRPWELPDYKEKKAPAVPPAPERQSRSEVPPEIAVIQSLPMQARPPAMQRKLELWEAEQDKENARRRVAALKAAAELPGATAEEQAKRAAEYLRSGEPLLLEGASEKVAEALEVSESGEKPKTTWDKIFYNLGRVWAANKAAIKRAAGGVQEYATPAQAWLEGFKHPEKFDEPLLPPEKVPERLVKAFQFDAMIHGVDPEKAKPEDIRRLVSGTVEFTGSLLTDPLTYVGVGPVVKAGKGLRTATGAAKELASIGKWSERMADISARASAALKEAQKAAKAIPATERRAVRLGVLAKRRADKFITNPPKADTAREKARQKVLEAWQKARDAQNTVQRLREVAAGESAAAARVQRAERVIETLRKRERQLTAKPPTYLTLAGRPVVNMEPVLQRVGAALTKIQASPIVQPVSSGVTRLTRLTTPIIREGATAELHGKDKETLVELYRRLVETGPRAWLATEKAAEKFAGIPKEAAERAAHIVERPEEIVQLKEGLPPELSKTVDRVASIWRADRSELTARLVQAFGESFEERLLKDYVPHIIVGSPDKKAKFVEEIANDPDKFMRSVWEEVAKASAAQARRVDQAAPGARPWFTFERTMPTLEAVKNYAKAYGLDVVEDLRVIDLAYRNAAEKLLWAKDTADWLIRQGWIVKRADAPKEWLKAVDKTDLAAEAWSAFPWLKESGMLMHPEAARLIEDMQHLWRPKSPELRKALEVYDNMMSLFKGAVTSLRPAFHVVNALGNMVLMRMAGIGYLQQADAMTDAVRIFTGKHKNAGQIMEWFKQAGLQGTGLFNDTRRLSTRSLDMIQDHLDKVTGGKIGKIKAALWPRSATVIEKVTGMSVGRSFGEFTDSIMRLAAFTHFLKKGMAPNQAARLVREYMNDYSHLTRYEKAARRFIFPFYSWAKFAAGRTVVSMLTQPGAFTGYQHLLDALDKAYEFDRDVLPSYLQWAVVLGNDDTGRVVFVNPQPPWQQAFEMASREWTTGSLNVGSEISGSVSPFITSASVVFKGIDPQTGKQIVEPFEVATPAIRRLQEALRAVGLPVEDVQYVSPGVKKALEVLKRFTPYSEIDKLYPDVPGKVPKAIGRVVEGLKGYPVSFLATYDVPLVRAKNISQAKELLDEYIRSEMALRGISREQMPEAGQVKSAEEFLAKEDTVKRVLSKATADTEFKDLLIAVFSEYKTLPDLENAIRNNADLFDGTQEEVVRKLTDLTSGKNTKRLAAYLGSQPTWRDFLDNRVLLEKGGLEDVPPQVRKLRSSIESIKRMEEWRKKD